MLCGADPRRVGRSFFSAGSRSYPPWSPTAHHGPPFHPALDEVVEAAGQRRQIDHPRDVHQMAGLEVRAEALPDPLADRIGDEARIDAHQADAAENEGEHRAVQFRAGGVADAGDRARALHRGDHPAQQRAADVVHRARPLGAFQGPDRAQVDARRELDVGGAEIGQIGRLRRLGSQCDDLVAQAGEHVDRQAADAAGGAGHQHRAVAGRQVVRLHAHDPQRGGEAGGAERHRFEQAQPVRQGHHPVGRHPGVFGIAAVVRDADVEGRRHHPVARGVARIGRMHDLAGQVDAADAGEAADDLAGAGRGQGVLVVDAGERHLDGDFTGIEPIAGELRQAAPDRAVCRLLDQQGLEGFVQQAVFHGLASMA